MKAISIWQPYAWLIAEGLKDVENRAWHSGYTGPLLVQASKRWKPAEIRETLSFLYEHELIPSIPPLAALKFQLGKAVALVDMTGCSSSTGHASRWANPGGYAFELAAPRRLQPLPLRGQQGLFTVSDEVQAQVIAQLKAPPVAPTPYQPLVERYRVLAGAADREAEAKSVLARYHYCQGTAHGLRAAADLLQEAIDGQL